MKNLAPHITRQRILIEGTTDKLIGPKEIKDYLTGLSKEIEMEVLREPFTYPAKEIGFGGLIHWITSGAHFYSYKGSPHFFTVDAYTCKPFSAEKAVNFTKKFFNAKEIEWKEVEV